MWLLLLPILLFPFVPIQDETANDSPITVLSFKWFKSQQVTVGDSAAAGGFPSDSSADVVPARADLERRKISQTAAVRDPSSDAIDKRSAELERMTEKSGAPKHSTSGYSYQAKILNKSTRTVQTVFWTFQFTEIADRANISRRQFVCRAGIKPDKGKVLEIFSRNGPTSVVSVGTLKKNEKDAFEGAVIINRVEYEDGSVWQRTGWNFDEVKRTMKPSDTRKLQPCQSL